MYDVKRSFVTVTNNIDKPVSLPYQLGWVFGVWLDFKCLTQSVEETQREWSNVFVSGSCHDVLRDDPGTETVQQSHLLYLVVVIFNSFSVLSRAACKHRDILRTLPMWSIKMYKNNVSGRKIRSNGISVLRLIGDTHAIHPFLIMQQEGLTCKHTRFYCILCIQTATLSINIIYLPIF